MNKFLFLFLLSFSIQAQSTLTGHIHDMAKNPIPFVNVYIKPTGSNAIAAYTTSDKDGNYSLTTKKTGTFELSFSAMSYKTATFSVEIEHNKASVQNAVLSNEQLVLKEVIVQSERPVTIKKDTITINVKTFLKGNETVVEDLLRNLPGVNVGDDGTIKIGNKEIEKVMVEGDDFFERGYKLLTKNLNANTIDKVEIYQKYSNNRLLKGIENSDKVAINLKLKKDLKLQWFGNMSLGYGVVSENRYELRTNLMSFGKKAKYYLIGNLNNTGIDGTGDIDQLIRPFRMDDIGTLGDDEQSNSLLSLNSASPSLKKEITNFNNAEMTSLNTIFTLSPKVKMKTLGFFNWDENDFFRNGFQSYKINNTSFTNTEDYALKKKKVIGFGKIDLTYDVSKTKMLEFTSKYNNGRHDSQSSLVFNNDPTIEKLKEDNQLIDQKLVFTNKISDKKVFIISGRYINEKSPQLYNINSFLFPDLFTKQSNTEALSQMSENKMQFAAIDGHLLDRKKNDNLLEIQAGFKFRHDILNTSLLFKTNNTSSIASQDYQNQVQYNSSDFYFKSKYSYKKGKYGLVAQIDAHQLINHFTSFDEEQKQQPFFVNPKIGINWEINKNNKVVTSYSYNTTNAKILDIYSNYVLTSYRNFDKGVSSLNQINASTLFFNYGIGNWGNKFFANFSAVYNKDHDFYSTNTNLAPNYSQTEKIIIKNRDMFSLSTNTDYFIKYISSNLKLTSSYSKSNYKNIVNSTNLREVITNNYNYGFELRSGFKGIFNYHIGSKWTTSEVETSIVNKNTNNMSFLDLNFNFSKKFNVDLQSERYFFGNLNKNNNRYYFLDLESKYTVKDNKLSFVLSGKNLFNTKKFTEYYVSDISVSSTEYRLLSRYVLLKIDYRF
ncbi:TonB-dependent receptor [Flavobacterium sp. SOK18b]|uniref:carboxypeptidase-like regulatory domain-containing protein n=1 Tax=Flavobacterium sp. SOK18b TaxID=797900 RepID=UPI0015FC05FA|nr:carboxypeptidase-like regulatory domain-containing protein [Flavobacterium sp. SOK18b]MBB1192657.1 TonB-dependent receptor [Flavobacterium sp. SOK18b]